MSERTSKTISRANLAEMSIESFRKDTRVKLVQQYCIAWVVTIALSSSLLSQQPVKPTETRGIGPKTIDFPIENGSIDGEQFYQRVVSQLHWTTELTSKLATEIVKSEELLVQTRVPLSSLEILCNFWPDAFQIVSPKALSPTGQGEGVFRADMTELEKNWSTQKLSLRQWLASRNRMPLYEVCGTTGFNGKAEQKQLVVVLPGLHGGEQSAIEFAKAIHGRTGIAACAFRYPNDAPLSESSEYLFEVLRQWHTQVPTRRIVVVTHSMGGLVARYVIEQMAAKDPKCLGVAQFVAICPPNQGSIFAEYAGVLEGADFIQRLMQASSGRKLLASVLDGFNEAPKDLVPGSEFLSKLNDGSRHTSVQYSIIAGDAGMIDPGLSQLGSDLLARLASRAPRTKSLQERADKLLNSAEFQKGSGDGVVTLQSVKLDGVKDIQVLPVNHLDWSEINSPEGAKIFQAVVERIGITM